MQKAEAVRRRIHELEPGRSVYAVMPLEEHLDEASSDNRLRTMTADALCGDGRVAGVHRNLRNPQLPGAIAAAGGGRAPGTRRVARSDCAAILMQGLRVSLVGCLAGVALARGLQPFIWPACSTAVSPLDPVTYLGVVVLILLVAALASLAPALRAARVEPVTVLRRRVKFRPPGAQMDLPTYPH